MCVPVCVCVINMMCPLCTRAAELTRASVVAFWIPHAKVSHGAGGEAHAYLTNVIALQEDEELGLASDAAVVLRAPVTAFGASLWRLRTGCSNRNRNGYDVVGGQRNRTPRNKGTRVSIQDIYFNKRIKERYAMILCPCEQHQGTLELGWYLHTSSYKPSSTLTLQRWGLVLGAYSDRGPGQTASFGTFTHCLLQKCLLQIVNRFSFREIHGNWLLTTAQEPVKLVS